MSEAVARIHVKDKMLGLVNRRNGMSSLADGDYLVYTQPEITVRVREVYGQPKYYPECEDAKVFAKIARTTTLTEETLRRIMKLGYKVKVLHNTNKFIEGELK